MLTAMIVLGDGRRMFESDLNSLVGGQVKTALHQSMIYCKDFGSERFLGEAFCNSASSR
jgi:hypothetical protein